MEIVPDSKDWTWVLERRCPECGFDSSALSREKIAPLTRSSAHLWQEILGATRPDFVKGCTMTGGAP